MTGFVERNGVLHVDDISLVDIAREFGTPSYVYSARVIRAQYEALADAMAAALPPERQPRLCYACKANSNIAVLRLLKSLGASLEIVSEGELYRGLKAGFDADDVIQTGVGKKPSEIAACLQAGIHQFNVESIPELARIDDIARGLGKRARVLFRLNPDVAGGGHHKTSTGRMRDKFGMSAARIREAFALAQSMAGVEALGLSVHVGSQVFEIAPFRAAFETLRDMALSLRAEGFSVTRLDIGGGFPIAYHGETPLDLHAYAALVNEVIAPLDVEILMEPGRYLVGDAGVLVGEVLYVKETTERTFLILDAAMNDLIRPTLYDAWHGVEPAANRDAPPAVYDVVGPVCESGDTFATGRAMAQMRPGELAVIRSAGAYGFSMASTYNTRVLPAEIMVDGDKLAVIRPRQTYTELLAQEAIPDWLAG